MSPASIFLPVNCLGTMKRIQPSGDLTLGPMASWSTCLQTSSAMRVVWMRGFAAAHLLRSCSAAYGPQPVCSLAALATASRIAPSTAAISVGSHSCSGMPDLAVSVFRVVGWLGGAGYLSTFLPTSLRGDTALSVFLQRVCCWVFVVGRFLSVGYGSPKVGLRVSGALAIAGRVYALARYRPPPVSLRMMPLEVSAASSRRACRVVMNACAAMRGTEIGRFFGLCCGPPRFRGGGVSPFA